MKYSILAVVSIALLGCNQTTTITKLPSSSSASSNTSSGATLASNSTNSSSSSSAVVEKTHYLYCSGGTTIQSFSIDSSTGSLYRLNTWAQNSGGNYTTAIKMDPSGKFIYAVDELQNIAAFSVDPDTGELTRLSPFQTQAAVNYSHGLGFDSSNHLWILSGTSEEEFSYDPNTGALTEIQLLAKSIAYPRADYTNASTITFGAYTYSGVDPHNSYTTGMMYINQSLTSDSSYVNSFYNGIYGCYSFIVN